jgi:hypothetical protein
VVGDVESDIPVEPAGRPPGLDLPEIIIDALPELDLVKPTQGPAEMNEVEPDRRVGSPRPGRVDPRLVVAVGQDPDVVEPGDLADEPPSRQVFAGVEVR